MRHPSVSLQIPAIAPVGEGTKRPRWSVMIPTFNCAKFLPQTIQSVLDQGISEDEMEIIVVDDVSTTDNPNAVALEVGRGRVKFVQNQRNLGATENFNRCIELSTGYFVHILHGDDWVAPGFYEEIKMLQERYPNCAFYATRTIGVEEDGSWAWLSPRVRELEQASNDVKACVNAQLFQTPSVVIRRDFYEQTGGFMRSLHHVADWEMWVRAIHQGHGVISSKPLACYRTFANNDSGRLAKVGANVIDQLKLIAIFAKFSDFDRVEFRKKCVEQSFAQANKFLNNCDFESALQNTIVYAKIQTRLISIIRLRDLKFILKFFAKWIRFHLKNF